MVAGGRGQWYCWVHEDRFPYDRGSKWLLQHHGVALLRLAGVTDIVSWRPLQVDVVQPRQLPDGLLEVRRRGRDAAELFVIELATYPERRVAEQMLSDLAMVYLNRGAVPEGLVVVLHPKGRLRAADRATRMSAGGQTQLGARWRRIELWTLPAEELLATGDPGAMPWVPLTHFEGPAEPIFQRCREVIETAALPR